MVVNLLPLVRCLRSGSRTAELNSSAPSGRTTSRRPLQASWSAAGSQVRPDVNRRSRLTWISKEQSSLQALPRKNPALRSRPHLEVMTPLGGHDPTWGVQIHQEVRTPPGGHDPTLRSKPNREVRTQPGGPWVEDPTWRSLTQLEVRILPERL